MKGTFKSNGITGNYRLEKVDIPAMVRDHQNEKLEYNKRLLIAGNIDFF